MDLTEAARASITRLSPQQAADAAARGALIIDLRTEAHRRVGGDIPGALAIDLTVLFWRLDPTFEWRIPEATGWDREYVLLCRHGYSSSVAAWQLSQIGLTNVADVHGGFDAWRRAGLPVAPFGTEDYRE